MFTDLKRKLGDGLDRLWVRIVVIAFLSLVAIVVARLSQPILPDRISDTVGADALDDLLKIIASSMLTVVTFSLSVMVSVYRSASSQWTPRIHQLMLEDRTTQNTLATFVGAFIYALTSIVLLRTSLFIDSEDNSKDPEVVLFFFTIIVLIMIVIAIVRWIVHLQQVGSLIDAARRIENRTIEAFEVRMKSPCLGGHPLSRLDDIPSDAYAVTAQATGYVQAIYAAVLNKAADDADIDVYLDVPIGRFIHRGETMCHLSSEDEDLIAKVRDNLVIGDIRNFKQDPRFGLIMLGEVGSKAMSPGVNDAGTAIDVIGRMARVLESFRSEMEAGAEDIPHHRLWVPPLAAADLIEDGFDPIARDGGGTIEVQLMLQSALSSLAGHPDQVLAEAARDAAIRSFRRAENQLTNEADLDRLRRAVPARLKSATG